MASYCLSFESAVATPPLDAPDAALLAEPPEFDELDELEDPQAANRAPMAIALRSAARCRARRWRRSRPASLNCGFMR
jgi:hypothetical protein